MKEKNKLIIAIVSVLAIIVLVGGATFAYWTWITSDAQQTTVKFKVTEDALKDQLYANLLGGGATRIDKIAPVTSCTDDKHAAVVELTLTYKNATTNAARINGTLTVSKFTTQHGTPTTADLGHLHYALTTSPSNCTTSPIAGATGVFTTTANGDLFTNVLLLNNISANMTDEAEQKYYLWLWLDSDYTPSRPNEGDTINDPLQNMAFTLTWSGEIANGLA